MLPAAGILIARRLEFSRRQTSRAVPVALAVCAAFSLLVAQSDFQLAVAMRQSAEQAVAKCKKGKTIWFEGHWGFQFYAEKLGARAVDYKNFSPSPADVLLLPLHNTYISEPPPEMVAHRDVWSVPGPAGLTTWNAAVGAGFYSSVSGPLPFAFGATPAESVFIYELKSSIQK